MVAQRWIVAQRVDEHCSNAATSMTSTAHFRITYDGPALEAHEMDVRELSPALLAVGDLLESANRVLYGTKAQIKVNVRASFKTGSFGIDLTVVHGLLDQLTELFVSKEASALANAAQIIGALGFAGVAGYKGLVGVLKWLRNRKITNVEIRENGAVLHVDDDQLEIELAVLALLRDYNTRRELANVIYKPLQREGIDTFAVGQDESIEIVVQRAEAAWFVAPEMEDEQIDDTEFETSVQISRIEFSEDNKWRFTDGVTSFLRADFGRHIPQPDCQERNCFCEGRYSQSTGPQVSVAHNGRYEIRIHDSKSTRAPSCLSTDTPST